MSSTGKERINSCLDGMKSVAYELGYAVLVVELNVGGTGVDYYTHRNYFKWQHSENASASYSIPAQNTGELFLPVRTQSN